jgi:hypothetical protein
LQKNLIRLTYVSTLRSNVTASDVDEIVTGAARFNKAHGITGILAIDKSRVCQILEGPAEIVGRLFASIERDRRHSGVTEIERHTIDAASFEDWGMVRRDMIDIVLLALRA